MKHSYSLLQADIYQQTGIDIWKVLQSLFWKRATSTWTFGHMIWTSSGNTFCKICSIWHLFQFNSMVSVEHSLIQ